LRNNLWYRASGYLSSLKGFPYIPLGLGATAAITLGDVAHIQWDRDAPGDCRVGRRRGVVGGVVIMRSGKNARETITAVQLPN